MSRAPGSVIAIPKRQRCAIYTRKSSEEGLDMEFNSLDAQREACEAYVASQKAEGWAAIRERYDDGGFSGGTLDRPGLKQLVADVEAGLIDVIVVYKIDRLSRSLMDFAKLVEIFDRNNVTFVTVTQSFNTTTSMGRLTLNILLSFAQFEREVIGERIRDKFAASRKKGMWMGGFVPLGYDVKDRKLVINEAEAATVRMIFERFVAIGSATTLAKALVAEGVRNKRGKPIDKGFLYKLLNNRVYLGEAVHKGTAYRGRARGDRQPRPLGQGPFDPWGKPAPASSQHPRAGTGVAEGHHFHRDRRGHDADGDKEGQPALPLLHIDGPDPEPGDGRRLRTAAPRSRNGRGRRRRRNSPHDPDARGRGAHDRRLPAGNPRCRRAGDRLGARQLRSALGRAVPVGASAPRPTSGRARHDRR